MQAFRIPELKKRIYFNLAMLAVFVLGAHIPVPGVDHNKLDALFGQGGFLGLVDVFSGGALRKMTIFAMGITPYIDDDLASGRLVAPFKVAVQQPYAYYLLTPEAISGRPAVETFRRWLVSEAEAMKEISRAKS